MDRINGRIAQAYGYVVCLICVIVILVSAHSLIDAAFDYSNPAASGMAYGRMGATTFEEYRLQHRDANYRAPSAVNPIDTTLSDSDLRKMFDAEKSDAIASAKFRALRSLVSSIIFLILSTTLFLLHWRWIRRTSTEPTVG